MRFFTTTRSHAHLAPCQTLQLQQELLALRPIHTYTQHGARSTEHGARSTQHGSILIHTPT